MATKEEYRSCMRPYMTSTGKTKEERQNEMCLGAKLCSGKASDRKEAEQICSLPKEPKEPKPRKSTRQKVNCEQNMEEITQCIVGKISPNTTAEEIYNVLVRCHCKKKPKVARSA